MKKRQGRIASRKQGKRQAVVRTQHDLVHNKILEGIKAYKCQQQEILDAIAKHGGRLHQDQFDNEFEDFETRVLENGWRERVYKPPRIRCWGYSRKSFVLGGMGDARSGSDWGKLIHLAQLMAQVGIIRIEGEPPNVFYVNPTGQGLRSNTLDPVVGGPNG